MGIIIKEIDGEYWLHDMTNTPFVMNGEIQNCYVVGRCGRMNDLCGLEPDKEYKNLQWLKDFEVVKRVPQVEHDDGLVYDDLWYKLKDIQIPDITHPLGKAWQQPDKSNIQIIVDKAHMTKETFNKLLEYSTSVPSGAYAGKIWKRRIGNEEYQLCWYAEPKNVTHATSEIEIRSKIIKIID